MSNVKLPESDADGWMPWSGGENPVPGQRVEIEERSGRRGFVLSDDVVWSNPSGVRPKRDIIAFRLAPTAPVEASGSERETERFRQMVEAKLAEAMRADHADAPFPMDEHQAASYHRTRADLLGWVLDMLPPVDGPIVPLTTPARAEAQDEGAAGDVETVCRTIMEWVTVKDPEEFVHWPQQKAWEAPTMPRWKQYEECAQTILARIARAHPSPTPAADDDRVRIAVEVLPNGTYQKSETVTATAEGEETFAELRQSVAEALPEPFRCAGGTDRIRKGDPVPGSKDRTYDYDRQAHVAFVAHHPRQALAALQQETQK